MKKIGEINTAQDQVFDIYHQGNFINRNRLYFRPQGETTLSPDRVSFLGKPQSFHFAGMLLRPELRGMGLSQDFIKAFTTLAEQMQVSFHQTCVIRKPIIAKVLKNMGSEALKTDKKVEILPTISSQREAIPSIAALSKGAKSLKSESGKFFNFVDPKDRAQYPSEIDESSKVWMNSPHTLSKLESPADTVALFSQRILELI